MNTKKILKIIVAVLLVMMIFSIIQPVAFAEISPDSITGAGASSAGESALQAKANQVAGLIRNVAIVVGVIMLMVIGVKFMLGSAEEKAEYKKSLMPLVVGIIIVMLASTIVSFVIGFVSK